MVKYGMSFEQLARDAASRRESDPAAPLLPDKMYRQIAQQSLDDMTMESSLTTRPTWLMTSSLGQMANPMLGWAVHKSYDAWRGFREPNGKSSMNGFHSGLLAYAAILPIGMAFAMLRDKFDEDVLGRKQSVADLTTIHDARSALTAVVDSSARIGTFGVAGEIPNQLLNQDGSRPISIDGRVFFVNTILNTYNGVKNLIHQQNFDYATVTRPLIQSIGGNGYLQYAGAVNHLLSLDDNEARVANRISVNNYLRVAGRELPTVSVRTLNGAMQTATAANPMKPYVGQMVMAAFANDVNDFQEARRNAMAEAMAAVESDKKMSGKDKQAEAALKVKQAFADQNPLRVVFSSLPTEREYQKMLSSMDSQGREAVAGALRMYMHYGSLIGVTMQPFARETQPIRPALTLQDARNRAF
jgi:hypothetical protein